MVILKYESMQITVNSLSIGECGLITGFEEETWAVQFSEKGIIRGKICCMLDKGIQDKTLMIQIDGIKMALRNNEAAMIRIEKHE